MGHPIKGLLRPCNARGGQDLPRHLPPPHPGGRNQPKRWYKLGIHGQITADEARIEAKRILGLVASGKDPALARRVERQKKGEPIDELLPTFITQLRKKRGTGPLRTKGEIKRILNKDLVPRLGKRRPVDVTTNDIKPILAKIEGRGAVMAARTEGIGKYGCVIAKVESLIRLDDVDLGEALVKAGLARPWPPKPGETWCPTGSP